MIHKNIPALFPSVFLVACSILGAGCSEDDSENLAKYLEVEAVVINQMTDQPVAGIKVMLMDPETNLPVAGPLVSDDGGRAYFGVVKENDWHPLAFGGVDYFVFAMTDGMMKSETDLSGSSPLSPVTKTSSPPIRTLEVRVFKTSRDSLPRISGKVVDTSTGLPLDQVFVSLSPYLTGYEGKTTLSDDVTLADGLYSASDIPFTINPITGNIVQINPLRFSRAGYRPVLHFEYPPNGHIDLDFQGVLIGMEPVTGEDSASISGKLVRDGAPAEGVTVGIGMVDLPASEKAGVGMPGWTGTTDAEGSYVIEGLPAGTYYLQPGFAVGDGTFFPSQPGNNVVDVGQGQVAEADDLIVLHEITPVSPAQGLRVSTPPDSLHWTPVPGADRYEVTFDRGILPPTKTNAAYLPEDLVINSDLHYWSVQAYGKNSDLLGANQVTFRFTYLPPED